MSYRGRASYNRAPNCASRNTKPYIVTHVVEVFPYEYHGKRIELTVAQQRLSQCIGKFRIAELQL